MTKPSGAHALHKLSVKGAAALSKPGRHRAMAADFFWPSARAGKGAGRSFGSRAGASARPVSGPPPSLRSPRLAGAPRNAGRWSPAARIPLRHGRRPATPPQPAGHSAILPAEVIETKRRGWRNARHAEQWERTLASCAGIWGRYVDEISADDVRAVLLDRWEVTPETARRLRARIEIVLDYAIARKLRAAPNPAQWKGGLEHTLPPREKLARRHMAALPYGRCAGVSCRPPRRPAVDGDEGT